MSYGAQNQNTCIKIIYDDGSWQPVLPGYYIEDDDSPTLVNDIEMAKKYNKPAGFYFHHPDYGTVLAADLQSVRIEAEIFGGKVVLN